MTTSAMTTSVTTSRQAISSLANSLTRPAPAPRPLPVWAARAALGHLERATVALPLPGWTSAQVRGLGAGDLQGLSAVCLSVTQDLQGLSADCLSVTHDLRGLSA